jgi:hypothetical protein
MLKGDKGVGLDSIAWVVTLRLYCAFVFSAYRIESWHGCEWIGPTTTGAVHYAYSGVN